MGRRKSSVEKFDEERISKFTTWAVRINEPEKAYLATITKTYGKTVGDFITGLVESLQKGTVVYDEEGFHAPKKEILVSRYTNETRYIEVLSEKIKRLEAKIEELEGQVEWKEDLLQTIRDTIREEIGNMPKKDTSENFSENKKVDIDLSELEKRAAEKRVTPQSLLDMMLRMYK